MEPGGGAAPETAELVRLGGDHVPVLLRRVEDRLRDDAVAHAGPLAGHGALGWTTLAAASAVAGATFVWLRRRWARLAVAAEATYRGPLRWGPPR